MSHIPVLLKEVVCGLNIKKGDIVLDATFGGGGHSLAICEIIGENGKLLAIDQDESARDRVQSPDSYGCQFKLATGNFRNLDESLDEAGIDFVNAAVFDLGVSSFQLDDSRRGFTFQKDEPLKMTFPREPDESHITAEDVVNDWSEESLADIIYGFGGERYAKSIARKIVEERRVKPIKSTFCLVKIIEEAVPNFYRRQRIHPATKTFQAIRIVVNDEIGALREALGKIWLRLKVDGRLAVISFHEVEDRVVKNFYRDKKKLGEALIITKKPIIPSREEILINIRSRSAKLRILEKIYK